MSVEPHQQANMFTGEWEAKRTRGSRPQQTQMFTINETFEFGQRVRPWLATVPAPALELISEDVRTSEEIERDLMRKAEEFTSPMFPSEATQEKKDKPDQQEVSDENDCAQPRLPPVSEKDTPLSCYLALVNLAHERAVTLWVDSAYKGRFYRQLPEAILTAQSVGLTVSEISAALQIGEFQGKQEYDAAVQLSIAEVEINRAGFIPTDPPTQGGSTSIHEGPPALLRREHLPVRTRHYLPDTSQAIPGMWTERESTRRGLMQFAEGISRVGQDELGTFALSANEALQEGYWMILRSALVHFPAQKAGCQIA